MTWEDILKDYSELTDEEEKEMKRGYEIIGEIYDNLAVLKESAEQIIAEYNKSYGKDRERMRSNLERLDAKIEAYRNRVEGDAINMTRTTKIKGE